MDYLQNLGSIGLPARLKRLSDSISSQISLLHKKHNLQLEARWFTITSLLNENEKLTVRELAFKLGITHPAVVQVINNLKEKGFVSSVKNQHDKRESFIELTKKGKDAYNNLRIIYNEIDNSLTAAVEDTGYDAFDFLNKLEAALGKERLANDVSARLKEKQLKEVIIVPYKKKYKKHFADLNKDWLKKYFTIEPTDKKILSSPEKEIISKGGEIFFALIGKDVIGTCAVIKIDDDIYELAKMAVAEKARGRQAGKKLALTAVGFAVSLGAKKIVLDTSPRLVEATNLYRSLGFVNVSHLYDEKYQRKLFRMELNLENV